MKYYSLREKVESGEFIINHVANEDNTADLFTKSLPKLTFQKLRSLAGIVNGESDNKTDAGASSR